MYICDSHVHTRFSFDSEADIDEIAQRAIELNIDEISLTDHMDIDGILDGIYPKYNETAVKVAVSGAKKKYDGRLKINFGVELGQPHLRPSEAASLIERMEYDFVLGSLHNLEGCPDFYFLKYELMDQKIINNLVQRSIDEQKMIAAFPGVNVLTHMTYMSRYARQAGVNVDYMRFADSIAELFDILIRNQKALEINSSGFEKDGFLMPDAEILKLYYKCGGRLLTFGSDAHKPENIGKGITAAMKTAYDIGFRSQVVFRNRKPVEIPLFD